MEGDDGPSAIGNKPTVIKGNRYYIDSFKINIIRLDFDIISSRYLEINLTYFLFTIKKLRRDFYFLIYSNYMHARTCICISHLNSFRFHVLFYFISSTRGNGTIRCIGLWTVSFCLSFY